MRRTIIFFFSGGGVRETDIARHGYLPNDTSNTFIDMGNAAVLSDAAGTIIVPEDGTSVADISKDCPKANAATAVGSRAVVVFCPDCAGGKLMLFSAEKSSKGLGYTARMH